MWWILPYSLLAVNLIAIGIMRKRLSGVELYATWIVVGLINLSTDIVLSLYYKLYELDGEGIQLSVHALELTLGPSYGVIFLNFMPQRFLRFLLYLVPWLAFALLVEALSVNAQFIHYKGWKLWYSSFYYIAAFFFLRWHLHFLRSHARRQG